MGHQFLHARHWKANKNTHSQKLKLQITTNKHLSSNIKSCERTNPKEGWKQRQHATQIQYKFINIHFKMSAPKWQIYGHGAKRAYEKSNKICYAHRFIRFRAASVWKSRNV